MCSGDSMTVKHAPPNSSIEMENAQALVNIYLGIFPLIL